jgi:hypothetical protein
MDYDVYRNRHFKKSCREMLDQIIMKRPEPVAKHESGAEEQFTSGKKCLEMLNGTKGSVESESQKFEAEVSAPNPVSSDQDKAGQPREQIHRADKRR